MANTIQVTSAYILRESLVVLENNLVAGSWVNKQYSKEFAVEGGKKGDVINVRVPPRYIVNEGAAYIPQNSTEDRVPVKLDFQAQIGLPFTNRDLTLSVDDFTKRFIGPAVSALANDIDRRVLSTARTFNNAVGTPGTVPASLAIYADAGVAMSDSAVPLDRRGIFLSSRMEATLVTALQGLFHQSAAIAAQYLNGQMGRAGGFLFHMDQNVMTHTVGPLGGAPRVNGVPASGATALITDGWTSAAANRLLYGDRYTIADVNSVNPHSRESTGQLCMFVVEADADSDGSGNLTVTSYPPMIASGQFQTIDAMPANNAVITVVGAANKQTKVGLALYPDAITLATADLFVPNGADMAGRLADDQLGISIRLWRDGDIKTDSLDTRLDILGGVKVIRREMGVAIYS